MKPFAPCWAKARALRVRETNGLAHGAGFGKRGVLRKRPVVRSGIRMMDQREDMIPGHTALTNHDLSRATRP